MNTLDIAHIVLSNIASTYKKVGIQVMILFIQILNMKKIREVGLLPVSRPRDHVCTTMRPISQLSHEVVASRMEQSFHL